MNENLHESAAITEEDIAFLLYHEELTSELLDLITKYQQATLEDLPTIEQTPITTEEPEYKIGDKCVIVTPYDKYQLVLLPAVILDYPSPDQVKVLILTPVSINMIACPAYLKNTSHSSCSFSHGYTVPINEILPFEALEMETISQNLHYNTKVWCKQKDDSLWRLGYITDQLSKSRWRVNLKNTSVRLIVDTEDLILFKCLDDGKSSESSESETEIERIDDKNWGRWETHSTGFASKMMKKMGYVKGQGLGRNAEGRIDPLSVNTSNRSARPGLGYIKTKQRGRLDTRRKKTYPFKYSHTVKGQQNP